MTGTAVPDPGATSEDSTGPQPLGVEAVGDGPPLLAVHGLLTGGRLAFGGVAERWGRHHRVLVCDRPGFERTPGPEASVVEQADRLLATIDAHTDGGPVAAIGACTGGLVLLRAVERRPQAFSSLVLVEVPAVDLAPSDMVEPDRLLAVLRAAYVRADEDLPGAVTDALRAMDPQLAQALEPLARAGDPGLTPLRGDLAVWQAMLDRQALHEAVSGSPPIPVLTVSGSRSHAGLRTFGSCSAAALAGWHQVMGGAGHAAHLHPGFTEVLLRHTGATA